MPRKSYRQHCGVARALDVVGERWTLLIVRNLLLGPRRYSDLLAELPGITTNLLAKRLRELEAAALLVKEEWPRPLAASAYRLSPQGAALEPVIMELGRWGSPLLGNLRPGDTFNLGWALLSLKRRYRGGLSATLEVRAGERRFTLKFDERALSVAERAADRPDLVLMGSEKALRTLLIQSQPLARLHGEVELLGSVALWPQIESALAPPLVPNAVAQTLLTTRRKLSKRNISVSSKRS